MTMDTTIIAAIIMALGGIVAAILGSLLHRERRARLTAEDRASASYPRIENKKDLSRDEVRQMVKFYGLFRRWATNPHLSYQEGDVSYWYEQKLTEQDLQREFRARQKVLEKAEESGKKIETQGDLSALAQRVEARE